MSNKLSSQIKGIELKKLQTQTRAQTKECTFLDIENAIPKFIADDSCFIEDLEHIFSVMRFTTENLKYLSARRLFLQTIAVSTLFQLRGRTFKGVQMELFSKKTVWTFGDEGSQTIRTYFILCKHIIHMQEIGGKGSVDEIELINFIILMVCMSPQFMLRCGIQQIYDDGIVGSIY